MAKTILGKDVKFAYVKQGAYTTMLFKTKKGKQGSCFQLEWEGVIGDEGWKIWTNFKKQ